MVPFKERVIHSGLNSLSLWGSVSFDFASLRSGRTGVIVQDFLKAEGFATEVRSLTPLPPSAAFPDGNRLLDIRGHFV